MMCAMKFQHQVSYAASPDQVFEMLADPAFDGTVEIVELDIDIKVPLIGGRLERLLAEKIRAGMDAEHGAGVAWLEGNR